MRKITKLYETIKEEELYAKNGAENSELLAGEQDSLQEDEKERIFAKAMEMIQKEGAGPEGRKKFLSGTGITRTSLAPAIICITDTARSRRR